MEFDDVMYIFPPEIKELFDSVPERQKASVYEIRIRAGSPLTVTASSGKYFLSDKGILSVPDRTCHCVTKEDIDEVFSRLCEHSLYSRERTVNNGYVVMRSGCRAGVCGTFSEETGNLRTVSSINIRIAHQVFGCERHILSAMKGTVRSVLIAGPPASGKTTVIRELCRKISDKGSNVCILDERGEIAGLGNRRFDVGACTDIYSLRKKAEAADMALRLMTPDVIAFDEIADDNSILNRCASCGTKIFCTIHAENLDDVHYRTKLLGIDRGIFDIIAVLRNDRTGEIEQLWERSGYNSA